MVGAAIAGGVIGLAQLGMGIYGTYKEGEYREEQYDLQKKANKINYQEGLQQLDQSRETLETNLEQAQDEYTLSWEQTQDQAQSQFDDAVANEAVSLEQAGSSLSDWKKTATKEESATKASAAASGIRNTGSVERQLSLQEEENDELELRAMDKIENETENFSRVTEQHWEGVEDYEERYNQKLAQLEETYDQKMKQLDDTESMLTKKYNAGVAINQSQYDYASDGAWLNYVSGGLGALNTGLNTFTSLNNIDWSNIFG